VRRGQSVTAADGYDAARRLGSINQWGADPGRSVTGLAGRAWSGPDRGVRRLHRPKHRFACSGLDFAHGHRQAEAVLDFGGSDALAVGLLGLGMDKERDAVGGKSL
jgi:hypothetical protein